MQFAGLERDRTYIAIRYSSMLSGQRMNGQSALAELNNIMSLVFVPHLAVSGVFQVGQLAVARRRNNDRSSLPAAGRCLAIAKSEISPNADVATHMARPRANDL